MIVRDQEWLVVVILAITSVLLFDVGRSVVQEPRIVTR